MSISIKELAKQAWRIPRGNSWHYANVEEFEQRFAELLLKECCSVLDQNEPLNTWTKKYSTLVKEHFGITDS